MEIIVAEKMHRSFDMASRVRKRKSDTNQIFENKQ